ncbi:alanine racemase [Streptomyces sp. TRM S81-3]|uniref:Alanine racemase n=1 Tax=Streptomyces griseicoloratus TaxID=2752516 RepID=A0A926L2S9_9ACTN|nr:alanine racemase [Streptomyces griseicoloratus]MBD0420344.1 alanine racemase [Streptomyces griseicoloratus]
MPRQYPPAFRRKVLDISDQTICTWRRQELIDTGRLPGTATADDAEPNAALKESGTGSGSAASSAHSVIAPEGGPNPAAGASQSLPPETWGLTRAEGGLCLEGKSLSSLADRWGSPLFVVHGARLAENVRRFQQVPPGRSLRVDVFYSYKTNPVPAVLQRLSQLGVGAEVVSPYELWLALRLGVEPGRIIYNGPGKTPGVARTLVQSDLLLTHLNHREEIALVAQAAAELGKRTDVGLRVATSDSWSGKFGIPIAGGQALAAYEEALSHPSLRVVGLHAHRGVAIEDADTLERFVREVLEFCDALHARLGLGVGLLDLGGSLAVPTVLPLDASSLPLDASPLPLAERVGRRLSVERYLALLVEQVEDHFRRAGRPAPRVLLEPGRALTGNTQILLCRVNSLNAPGAGPAHAILDAGENIAHILHREYHEIFHAERWGDSRSETYTLDGPTCSPMDCLRQTVELPPLRVGDTLAVMDAGAYLVSFSNSFCFPQPGIVVLDHGRETLVRRPETYEDMIARDLHANETSR